MFNGGVAESGLRLPSRKRSASKAPVGSNPTPSSITCPKGRKEMSHKAELFLDQASRIFLVFGWFYFCVHVVAFLVDR